MCDMVSLPQLCPRYETALVRDVISVIQESEQYLLAGTGLPGVLWSGVGDGGDWGWWRLPTAYRARDAPFSPGSREI